MSNFAWIIVIVLILTALGSGTLFFITLKYYWGVRGTPPPTGEERKRLREEELRLRAKQIEHARKNKWETRSADFFDNTKRSTKR
jgi:hypothetical protein